MKNYRNYKINVVLFFLILIFVGGTVEATIRVDPGRFIFQQVEGERSTGAIKVTNKGDKEVELKAFLYDWNLDENDKLVTYEAGSRKDTLMGLIKFNPRKFTIPPGETQVVRFTIDPVKGEKIERRGIVFFEQEIPEPDQITGARVIAQIGTTIYVVPPDTKYSFQLLAAKVHHSKDGSLLGLMAIANDGNAHIRYQVDYKIVDEKGVLHLEGSLPYQIILPGNKKGISFPIEKKLSPGKYNLLISIDFHNSKEGLNHSIPFSL